MAYPKFHGITLANNSVIENLHVERLAADPVPATAGRIWINTTEKKFKFTGLDGTGAVVVYAFSSQAELDAAIATEVGVREAADTALSNRIATIEGEYASQSYVTSAIAALGNAFEYVGLVTGGTEAGSAFDLSTLTQKAAGDYYKVGTGGYFKVGAAGTPFYANAQDGLLWNIAGEVDKIDNTDYAVAGTVDFVAVTGSPDVGYTIDISSVFKNRVVALETGLAAEVTARGDADAALSTRIDSLESSVGGATGDLALLTTDVKTDLVSAINEVDANVNSEVAARIAADGDLATLTTTAKSSLVAAINEVDADLAAEIAARTAADATLTSDLAAEATARAAADSTLTTNLAAEVTRAQAAEATLQSNIDAEAAARAAADGNLATLTTTAKSSLVAAINEVDADIAAEVTRAQAAEATLQSNIDAEASARSAADATLTTNLAGEVSRASAAEATLQSNIDAEASARAAADSAEATARAAGDQAVRDSVNAGKFSFTAAAAALTHVVQHNLNTSPVLVSVYVEGDDGKFRNDIVAVEETSNNAITVGLTESRRVKVAVLSLAAI